MQAAQDEGQQGSPQGAEQEQHGDRPGIVQVAVAQAALAEAQAHRQAEAELAGFVAVALQACQQQAHGGEQRQAEQRMRGGGVAEGGRSGAEGAHEQHAQHAVAVQRIGQGRLERPQGCPQEAVMAADQAEYQGQGAAERGDSGDTPDRCRKAVADGMGNTKTHGSGVVSGSGLCGEAGCLR